MSSLNVEDALANIVFDGGSRRVSRASFDAAPGGWQGRVLRGSLLSGGGGGSAGGGGPPPPSSSSSSSSSSSPGPRRVAVKLFIANASPDELQQMGSGQTDAKMKNTWLAEVRVLTELQRSPEVADSTVGFLGSGEIPDCGQVVEGFEGCRGWFIVMDELAETLDDRVLGEFLRAAEAMAGALAALHRAGWSHGDVHRGNFMFEGGGGDGPRRPSCRLIDFGNSQRPCSAERERNDVACFGRRALAPLPALSQFSTARTKEALAQLQDLVKRCQIEGGGVTAADVQAELADMQMLAVESDRGLVRLVVERDEQEGTSEPQLCLHVENARADTGAPVRAERACNALHQLWTVQRVSRGYQIAPVHAPAMRLKASPLGLLELAPLKRGEGGEGQVWDLMPAGHGDKDGERADMCISLATPAPMATAQHIAWGGVEGEVEASAPSLAIRSCEPVEAARFRLRAASVVLVHRASGLVLDHYGGAGAVTVNEDDDSLQGDVGLYTRGLRQANQQWTLKSVPGVMNDATFVVCNRASKLALDCDVAGRDLKLWTAHGGNSQRWRLVRVEEFEDAYRVVAVSGGVEFALDAGDVGAAADDGVGGGERGAPLSLRNVAPERADAQIFCLDFDY